MNRAWILLALPLAAFATGPGGLKPRPAPGDYPAHETAGGVTIAAAVLTPEQVKSAFSTDLTQYVVIEVGVYPGSGQTLELSSADFALRIGAQGEIERAANPRAIAASNQRKNTPKPSRASDVTIYPTANIGYESGGYDPITGRRRGGVYTDTGVGVGIGDQGPQPPRPGSTDRDRAVMDQELADKTLPDVKTSDPVAGYLYFRLSPKTRTSALELQYLAAGGRVRVLLPAPRGK